MTEKRAESKRKPTCASGTPRTASARLPDCWSVAADNRERANANKRAYVERNPSADVSRQTGTQQSRKCARRLQRGLRAGMAKGAEQA